MSLYLDTSVAGTLLLRDAGADACSDWLEHRAEDAGWSDFANGELVSAIGLRVRRGQFTETDGTRIVDAIADFTRAWLRFSADSPDIAAATGFLAQFDLGLRLPDAIHIAMAQRLDCTLVSTDRRQLKAARALGVPIADPSVC
ncbi:MAG: type II toxin-antitoxin system VapC family toxin [Pseudomonadota bacterium]